MCEIGCGFFRDHCLLSSESEKNLEYKENSLGLCKNVSTFYFLSKQTKLQAAQYNVTYVLYGSVHCTHRRPYQQFIVFIDKSYAYKCWWQIFIFQVLIHIYYTVHQILEQRYLLKLFQIQTYLILDQNESREFFGQIPWIHFGQGSNISESEII